MSKASHDLAVCWTSPVQGKRRGSENSLSAGGCRCRYGAPLEHYTPPVDQAFAVGIQEAVVPSAAKAFGQDMAQEVPEERGARQGPGARLAGLAVLVPEGHFVILAGEDVS